MRLLALVALLPVGLAAQDLRAIVRRSIEHDRRNTELSRSYTLIHRQEEHQLDDLGKVKAREVRTWDITLLEGSPYKRLIAREDKPLSPKEEQLEAQKLRKSIEERSRETPELRARRISEWEKSQQKRREPLQEMPDAFDFKLLGEETINGGKAWVIDGTPRPGYKPKLSSAAFFPKVKVRVWVDQKDFQWAKVDLETLDTVSFGGLLFRLSKGSHLVMEQARVNNEVWLPKLIDLHVAARLLLIKGYRRHYILTYGEYKKFQAESRVLENAAR